jgi:hypothetical protein
MGEQAVEGAWRRPLPSVVHVTISANKAVPPERPCSSQRLVVLETKCITCIKKGLSLSYLNLRLYLDYPS